MGPSGGPRATDGGPFLASQDLVSPACVISASPTRNLVVPILAGVVEGSVFQVPRVFITVNPGCRAQFKAWFNMEWTLDSAHMDSWPLLATCPAFVQCQHYREVRLLPPNQILLEDSRLYHHRYTFALFTQSGALCEHTHWQTHTSQISISVCITGQIHYFTSPKIQLPAIWSFADYVLHGIVDKWQLSVLLIAFPFCLIEWLHCGGE